MAIITLPGGIWLPAPLVGMGVALGAPAFGVGTIDAADEGVAYMVRVPKTGNVRKIIWSTRTVSSGATLLLRIETWDETVTPAVPSTTLFHASATASQVVAAADDNTGFATQLAADIAVTRGDKWAVIVKNPAASFGNIQLSTYSSLLQDFPYVLLNTGVSPAFSWAALAGAPTIALEYDDGSVEIPHGCVPFTAVTPTTVNNTDTPDELSLRFKTPASFPTVRADKWWAYLDADGDFNVKLYGSDGATPIAGGAVAFDKDARRTAAVGLQRHPLLATADLVANTYYRLAFEPSSATSIILYDFTVLSSAVMDALEGGSNFHLSTAKDPNEESDWTNTTTRRLFAGVGFNGIDGGGDPRSLILQPSGII